MVAFSLFILRHFNFPLKNWLRISLALKVRTQRCLNCPHPATDFFFFYYLHLCYYFSKECDEFRKTFQLFGIENALVAVLNKIFFFFPLIFLFWDIELENIYIKKMKESGFYDKMHYTYLNDKLSSIVINTQWYDWKTAD